MRKAHFRAVDGAAAGALDDGQQVMVFGVEDDALGGDLCRKQSAMTPEWPLRAVAGDCRAKSHLESFECGGHDDASAIRRWADAEDGRAFGSGAVHGTLGEGKGESKTPDSTSSGDGTGRVSEDV